jgi:hypothetical protein
MLAYNISMLEPYTISMIEEQYLYDGGAMLAYNISMMKELH